MEESRGGFGQWINVSPEERFDLITTVGRPHFDPAEHRR